MKYMGSKNRIAKEIIPIMLKDYEDGMIFIDACCGGCNLIDKIPDHIPRYANDINEYLIEMFKSLQSGKTFPYISEDIYDYVKNNKEKDKSLTGYVGFNFSFGSKFFGGYRRDIKGTKNDPLLKKFNEDTQNRRTIESFSKQMSFLDNVKFSNKSVLDINPIKKSIIYFDIPYKGTTPYLGGFDHELFYKKCIDLKKKWSYYFCFGIQHARIL